MKPDAIELKDVSGEIRYEEFQKLRAPNGPEQPYCKGASEFVLMKSGKDHRRQPGVVLDVAGQVAQGQTGIVGLMLESFLVEGRQDISGPEGLRGLVYGQSVTDACMSWETTEPLLHQLADAVRARRSA